MPPYHYTNHAELLAQIPDEPLRDLLAALLMQESPPMTEAWAAGCVQRLKEYALRRKRAPLVAELAQPTAQKPPAKRRKVAGITGACASNLSTERRLRNGALVGIGRVANPD
jgi:hypothetical protein